MKTSSLSIKKTVFSGLMLAAALLLPFVTGQIPEIGKVLSPMHIPVLIAGLLCGSKWGFLVGIIAPVLRSLIFTMPPMPVAIIMSFELAAYGFVAGLIYSKLKKTFPNLMLSLVIAMLAGRFVWGIASFLMSLVLVEKSFSFQAFLAGGFIKALPGIIVHLIVVPAVVLAVEKVGWIEKNRPVSNSDHTS